MKNIRVYELARELQIESRDLVDKIKTLGILVNGYQSKLSDSECERIRSSLAPKSETTKRTTVIRRRKKAPQPEPAEVPPATVDGDVTHTHSPTESGASDQQATLHETKDATDTEAKTSDGSASLTAVDVSDPSSENSQASKSDISGDVSGNISRAIIKDSAAAQSSPDGDSQDTSGGVIGPQPKSGPTLSKVAQKLAYERSLAKAKEQEDLPFRPAKTLRKAPPQPKKPAQLDIADVEKKLSLTTTRSFTHGASGRREEPVTGADPLRPRPVAKKERRSQISARDLLSRLDSDESDFTPRRSKKTIYAPMSHRGGRDHKRRKDLKKTQITTPKASLRVVQMADTTLSVGDLARQLSIKSAELIKHLMKDGVMATVNQQLDSDTIELVAEHYGYKVQAAYRTVEEILARSKPDQSTHQIRPPIVTLMGHVDHGKTSILDAIRQSAVSEDETGGITQHIGAYKVEHDGRGVTFLDTPGHEAFSSIRSRGAQITDMVVLVVAADDGVMPQTVEAISHSKNADVPIIVALNKIDKAGSDIDRIYSELAEHGVQSEDWGGDHQFVKMSALKKTGIDDLLEAILLQAELMELQANPETQARGVIIEAHKELGRGVVATIMVTEGTFRTGDRIVAGVSQGRIRSMVDDAGREVPEAKPSTPVQIIGFSDIPSVGDEVDWIKDHETGRAVVARRREEAHKSSQKSTTIATLEELLSKVDEEKILAFPFIIKADTQGSMQAICEALQNIKSDKIRAKIVHSAIGAINASDIALAAASGAIIFGFHVRALGNLAETAEESGVVIEYYGIIYELIDAAKNLMAGSLPAIKNEITIGHADVKQPISIPKIGLVAGASVVDGRITRGCGVRLIRDSIVVHSSKVASLRRFKSDVKEVNSGYECGIGIENCRDIREGDVIEAYEFEEVPDTL